jgi:hypothetical protein
MAARNGRARTRREPTAKARTTADPFRDDNKKSKNNGKGKNNGKSKNNGKGKYNGKTQSRR